MCRLYARCSHAFLIRQAVSLLLKIEYSDLMWQTVAIADEDQKAIGTHFRCICQVLTHGPVCSQTRACCIEC